MRAAFLACMVLAAPVFGQAPKKLVGDHEVKRGGFAQLTVEGAGKTVVWMVAPNPIQKAQICGVLVFTGEPGAVYTVTAVVVDFDKKTIEQIEHDVKFLGEPVPPVPPTPPTPPIPPTPPVPPTPPPEPNPMPGVVGLHMLIVYESGDLGRYPSSQVAAMNSKAVFDYLKANGAADNWRVWDQNVQLPGVDQKWKDALKRPRTALPWVIVSNGKTGFEGPLPKDSDTLLALIKKYGD